MELNKSKFAIFLALTLFSFSLMGGFMLAAERGLEVEYPKLDGEEITATTTLPEYVKYIFKFSLIIAAVLAFAILIYGGFRYLTSAGSPGTMREAKSWMFGGILGLVLLLCSYLILTTINPELLSPKEPELMPTTGIYLINDKGEKLYFIDDAPMIAEEFKEFRDPPFGATDVMFFDDRPAKLDFADPDKTELYAIFVYPEMNYMGNPKRIENTKGPDDKPTTEPLDFPPKSLKFLWHIPGVYLYEKVSFATPPPPRIYQASKENLGDFNDKAESISFVNIEESEYVYDSVLFQHIHFKGKCTWANQNLSPLPYTVQNDLSSIAIFKSVKEFPQELSGEIIFYDQQNCQGNSYSVPEEPDDLYLKFGEVTFEGTDKPLENNVESFMINGNFALLLNTEKNFSKRCQFFYKKGCQSSLKGTYVYSSLPVWLGGFRPVAALIFIVME